MYPVCCFTLLYWSTLSWRVLLYSPLKQSSVLPSGPDIDYWVTCLFKLGVLNPMVLSFPQWDTVSTVFVQTKNQMWDWRTKFGLFSIVVSSDKRKHPHRRTVSETGSCLTCRGRVWSATLLAVGAKNSFQTMLFLKREQLIWQCNSKNILNLLQVPLWKLVQPR